MVSEYHLEEGTLPEQDSSLSYCIVPIALPPGRSRARWQSPPEDPFVAEVRVLATTIIGLPQTEVRSERSPLPD